MSNDLVVKANEIVEASYYLSTIEQRLMLSAIAQIPKETEVSADAIYYVHIQDFIDLGSNEKNAWRDLADATEKLWNREIVFYNSGEKIVTRWLQQKAIKEGGRVGIRFSTPLIPYLTNLSSQFTQYLKKDIAGVKSAYTIRFYEMICRYRKVGECGITIEQLRSALSVGDKYPLFADLNRRVIVPAIKELNEKTPMKVSCAYTKQGKKTTGIKLSFKDARATKKSKQANLNKAIEAAKNGNPMWMQKGLSDKQLKKLSIHRIDFIDMNNSPKLLTAGGVSSHADYNTIWNSWQGLLASPDTVGMFKGIQEILDRPKV